MPPVVEDSIFSPIIPATAVEEAVTEVLQIWMDPYLREVERQWSITEELAPIMSWNVRPETDHWPEEQLPALIVVSGGTTEDPLMDGDGRFTAIFQIGTVIFAKGINKENTNRNARVYAAAARAIMLQQDGLDGLSDGVRWKSEHYDEAWTTAGRTLVAAQIVMEYAIPHVVRRWAGPSLPPEPTDGTMWPAVESTEITIDKHRHLPEQP